MKHECVIGMLNDYEDTGLVTFELVTFDELKEHIKKETDFTVDDYCDKRKTTNLTRFECCPICGKKIDWNKMKRSE